MRAMSQGRIDAESPPPKVSTIRSQSLPKKKRSKPFLRFPLLIVFAMIVYFLVGLSGLKMELYKADVQILALEQEREILLEKQQALISQKEKLDSLTYVERRAREALGLIRPGEKILIPAEQGEVMSLKLEGIDEIGD